MTRFSLPSAAVCACLVIVASVCAACAGPQLVSRPGWVDNPPNHDSRFLYFVAGSGWRSSESDAKSSAKLAASAEVPRYISSQIQSLLADVQINENGVDINRVEIAVTVVGTSVTIREVSALEYWCARSSSGYDCSALVAYPRAEYNLALAEIDAARKEHGERQAQSAMAALAAYDQGRQLESAGQPCPAMQKYEDSEAVLNDVTQPMLLPDSRFANTDLLSREVAGRLVIVGTLCSDTEKWLAVRVVVDVDGASSESEGRALFARVAGVAEKFGFVTNLEIISSEDAARCLSGNRDVAMGAAGPARRLLVIREGSTYSGDQYGMIFYCKADVDWAIVDPSTGVVIDSDSPRGFRGSAVSRAGACVDALNEAWFPKDQEDRPRCMKERLARALSGL